MNMNAPGSDMGGMQILPWNLRDEIVLQMQQVGDWGGKFVVPIPEVTVIDPRELQR
jgi:hypothetical protein